MEKEKYIRVKNGNGGHSTPTQSKLKEKTNTHMIIVSYTQALSIHLYMD